MSFVIVIGTYSIYYRKYLARIYKENQYVYFMNKYGDIVHHLDKKGQEKICFNTKRDLVRTIKKYFPDANYTMG